MERKVFVEEEEKEKREKEEEKREENEVKVSKIILNKLLRLKSLSFLPSNDFNSFLSFQFLKQQIIQEITNKEGRISLTEIQVKLSLPFLSSLPFSLSFLSFNFS